MDWGLPNLGSPGLCFTKTRMVWSWLSFFSELPRFTGDEAGKGERRGTRRMRLKKTISALVYLFQTNLEKSGSEFRSEQANIP